MTAVIMFGSFGNAKIANKISNQIIKQKLSPCVYFKEFTSICKNGKGKETIGIIKTTQKKC